MFAQNKNFCALVLSKNNALFAKHACFSAKIRKGKTQEVTQDA